MLNYSEKVIKKRGDTVNEDTTTVEETTPSTTTTSTTTSTTTTDGTTDILNANVLLFKFFIVTCPILLGAALLITISCYVFRLHGWLCSLFDEVTDDENDNDNDDSEGTLSTVLKNYYRNMKQQGIKFKKINRKRRNKSDMIK